MACPKVTEQLDLGQGSIPCTGGKVGLMVE